MNAQTTKRIKLVYTFLQYSTVILMILYGALILSGEYKFNFTYKSGHVFGYTALFFFTITILPGILRRFEIRSKLFVTYLTAFKRQNGDQMFLFALLHYLIIKLLPLIQAQIFPPPFMLFELFGLASLWMAAPLFLTSNNFSKKKLGKYWYILHKLVYIIVWTIFLHVALNTVNIVTVLIGILAVLETTSLIYSWVKNRAQESKLKNNQSQ